jgi:DNA (cytosine-5)-methyltransferase 3A
MSTKDNIEILTLDHYLELKNQNFEFEGQSYLFWEYMRILHELKEINPNIKFLLENVIMGEKWENILTRAIGIKPIRINSALVSAQNRNRLYWTNIYTEPDGFFGDLVCKIPQPKDKGILLKDILEGEVDEKYFLSDKMLDWLNRHSEKTGNKVRKIQDELKTYPLTSFGASRNNLDSNYIETNRKARCFTAGGNSGGLHSQMDLVVHNTMPRSSKTGKGGTGPLSRTDGKTYCLDTGNTNAVEIQCVAMRGRNPENPKSRVAGLETEQQLEPRNDGKTNYLTSVQKDNLVMQINPSKESEGVQPYQHNRVYDIEGISPCLNTDTRSPAVEIKSGTLRTHNDGKGFREVVIGKGATIPARSREDGSGQNVVSVSGNIRRLTPTECERLQTVDDGYTAHVSDSQRYKMLGNGWTIDVIGHILSYYN